jgi:CubicO group peptidase (beta-lactamase class C family)
MKLTVAAVSAGLAILCAAHSAAAPNPEAVGLSRERLARIDAMIEQRIAAGDLTGAVTIVARRGQVAHLSVQGVMDVETRQPMRADTMFRIASMTKPIVGVAVMMMVEENKLRLGDPVSRYIPEFRAQRIAVARPEGGSGPAGFDLVPAEREITVKDLLTHVSGLGSGPMSNSTIDPVARREGETLADYIPRLGGTALEFQPGSRWAYSPGAGFETLGRILEIVSGMPLDELFAKRIFAPLGMRDITFWPTDAQWQRVATVYRREDNAPLTKAVMPNDTMSRNVYFRGSGGLYGTAEGYAPFGIMLANGGELGGVRLLSRKSVEMLGAVHVPDTLPGRPSGEGYGLSVRVVTDHAARGTLLSDGTYGWSGAQGTHFFVDPKEQLVGVLMVQTPNNEVRDDFENLVAQAIVD